MGVSKEYTSFLDFEDTFGPLFDGNDSGKHTLWALTLYLVQNQWLFKIVPSPFLKSYIIFYVVLKLWGRNISYFFPLIQWDKTIYIEPLYNK